MVQQCHCEKKRILLYRVCFIAIGSKTNTDIFKGTIGNDETGYLITQGKSTKQVKPGFLPVEMFG